MQGKNLKLRKIKVATIPIINACVDRLKLHIHLEDALGSPRYASAILVLLKSVLVEPTALYRVPAWAKQFDSEALGVENVKDDLLGRALDRLFKAQRATLQTKVAMDTISEFDIDVSQIHNDSTSVKFYGAYKKQAKRAVQLKNGHSKDHRPDLKQLLYNLSVARDGSIPIHFKTHDGNKTDDTTHVNNWLTLRGLVGTSEFLYVADSKLCTSENMKTIDREQGRFVTIVPRTRKETQTFSDECYAAAVRWRPLTRRRSSRVKGLFDVFSVAVEPYQLEEGFRLYWYRSSEKRKRDAGSRRDRIETTEQKLTELNEKKQRGARTEKSLLKKAHQIMDRYRARSWFDITVTYREEETFTKTTRGKPSTDSTYRRKVKRVPLLVIKKEYEQIGRSKAIDGIFPLTTNTTLAAKEVLDAYKYQPNIEKRFSGLKSDLQVAPVFLKKTERIEALMLVIYLADLVAALIQRDLRQAMRDHGTTELRTLPEERPTRTPTWEQVQRLFANQCKYELWQGPKLLRTFADDLTEQHSEVLRLLSLQEHHYRATT